MINHKTLTLSIVIPVYNEQSYLKDCLDSIAGQTIKPDEVIVVDNNSSDRSLEIAQLYPFVKIVREQHQHQAFAQKTGFNAAKGEIIGRIDADSILPRGWVETVKRTFMEEPNLQAVTGGTRPYDVYLEGPAISVFMFYHTLAGKVAGTQMLWGANSAIRKSAWERVSGDVLQRADIWEDYDLSLLIGRRKSSIRFVAEMEVGSSFRAIHKPLTRQIEYQFRMIRTYFLRGHYFKAPFLLTLWSSMIVFYPLVLIDSHLLKPLLSIKVGRREVPNSSVVVE